MFSRPRTRPPLGLWNSASMVNRSARAAPPPAVATATYRLAAWAARSLCMCSFCPTRGNRAIRAAQRAGPPTQSSTWDSSATSSTNHRRALDTVQYVGSSRESDRSGARPPAVRARQTSAVHRPPLECDTLPVMRVFRFDEEVSVPAPKLGSGLRIARLTGDDSRARIEVLHLARGAHFGSPRTERPALSRCVGWVGLGGRRRRTGEPTRGRSRSSMGIGGARLGGNRSRSQPRSISRASSSWPPARLPRRSWSATTTLNGRRGSNSCEIVCGQS